MQLVADENFPAPVVRLLREHGHDVLSVKEQFAGITDEQVLHLANSKHRILVTLDKDFGELAVRHAASAIGIILFRLTGDSPAQDNIRIVTSLESDEEWMGYFSVVTDKKIRKRPLFLLES